MRRLVLIVAAFALTLAACSTEQLVEVELSQSADAASSDTVDSTASAATQATVATTSTVLPSSTTAPSPTPTDRIHTKGDGSLGCGFQRLGIGLSGDTLAVSCGLSSGFNKDSLFLFDLANDRIIAEYSSPNYSFRSFESVPGGFIVEVDVTTPASGLDEASRSSEVWFVDAAAGAAGTLAETVSHVCRGPAGYWIGVADNEWIVFDKDLAEVFRIPDTSGIDCESVPYLSLPAGASIVGSGRIAVRASASEPLRVFSTDGALLWSSSDHVSAKLHEGSPYALTGSGSSSLQIRDAETGAVVGSLTGRKPGAIPTSFGLAMGLSDIGPMKLVAADGSTLCEFAEGVRGPRGWWVDSSGDIWIDAADGGGGWILVDVEVCDEARRESSIPGITGAPRGWEWSIEESGFDQWIVIH